MAEIKIQKKRNPVWLWIIAIILIGIIIWILFSYANFTKKGGELSIFTDSTQKQQEAVLDSNIVSEINNFDLFVNNSAKENNLIDYTKEGLHKLSVVLNTMINQNDTLQVSLKDQQDTLRKDI